MPLSTDVPDVPTTAAPAPAPPPLAPSPLTAVMAQLVALRQQTLGVLASLDAALAQVGAITHGMAAAQAARATRPAPGAVPPTFGFGIHQAPITTTKEHDHGHQGHEHDGADAAHVERIIDRAVGNAGSGGDDGRAGSDERPAGHDGDAGTGGRG